MYVAVLEGAGEGEDERDVFLVGCLLADDLDVRWGTGRESTGERRVAVDVELEKMEERVIDEGNCAVDLCLLSVVEFQRFTRLLAVWEGNPFELMFLVYKVLARLTVVRRARTRGAKRVSLSSQ